ncbi:hypothetical protein BU23DRAFT_597292 [Bimuria novae-zelandiae CBS 107.79]|uniref:Uncharacterized protein n=1 Tax=Bimuria novae-zelandiae CBS 107.79 TaxID=1447943 RepID=A0A6A5VGV9_9PLEO|nr:hypothetical protein BU23DRAFT_597292 [Bimuria novae-zelandiae CBS 107.79]
MSYQPHAHGSHYDRHCNYSDGYRNTHGYRSAGFTWTPGRSQEPHVFLDLRNYYSSAGSSDVRPPSQFRRDYNDRHSNYRSSDYIREPSTSRFENSRTDYISRTSESRRYQPPSPEPIRYAAEFPAYRSTGHTSSWDKSDYQIIKDGWGDKKNFMESHGLSIYEHDDFEEARQILDGYRRIDAHAAGEQVYESDDHSSRHEHYGRYRERDEHYHEYDSDLIGSYADDDRIATGGEGFGSDHREPVERDDSYEGTYTRGSDERQENAGEGSGYDSTEYDSTDAIGYYSDSVRGKDDDIGGEDFVDYAGDDDYDDDDEY